MQNNYYFLRQLTTTLNTSLNGATLAECFTQNKNELIFGFTKNQHSLYIKAHLDPSFCCLAFPEDFHRARKNSVDLFPDFINHTIVAIKQFENERCFALTFSNDWKLLFKMHGNRSNVISYDEHDQIKHVFNSKLKKDYEIDLKHLDRPINQSKASFEAHEGDLKIIFPTFGKEVLTFLKNHNYESQSIEEKWRLVNGVLSQLNSSNFYIKELDYKIEFSLLETNAYIEKHTDPLEAINKFFNLKVSTAAVRELKHQTITQIKKSLKQSKSYIDKTKNRLNKIANDESYNQLADILMANLHQIPAGASETTLPNFYNDNKSITIKLKKTLSPQKNAESLYRKSKNQSKEIDNLTASIKAKEQLINELELHLLSIEEIEHFKELKQYLKANRLEATQSNQEVESKPFNEFEFEGYQIFVGKNAKSNDKMLQQYAYKEDLWLHAKDVSGSHVLIKHQAGKNYPNHVIEAAASVAAYHSKRKTDTLCPVIVTPKKFVRKRKGDPPGAVVVDKEETIMVEPKARP